MNTENNTQEKLSDKEILVKDFTVTTNCIGTLKTNTKVMLSFTKIQDDFEYIDVFMSWEQVKDLRDSLNTVLVSNSAEKNKKNS